MNVNTSYYNNNNQNNNNQNNNNQNNNRNHNRNDNISSSYYSNNTNNNVINNNNNNSNNRIIRDSSDYYNNRNNRNNINNINRINKNDDDDDEYTTTKSITMASGTVRKTVMNSESTLLSGKVGNYNSSNNIRNNIPNNYMNSNNYNANRSVYNTKENMYHNQNINRDNKNYQNNEIVHEEITSSVISNGVVMRQSYNKNNGNVTNYPSPHQNTNEYSYNKKMNERNNTNSTGLSSNAVTPIQTSPNSIDNTNNRNSRAMYNYVPSSSKPYQCCYQGCNKVYKHLNGILNHYIISHVQLDSNDQKPFKCTIPNCDKEYKQALGLAYHLENNHAEELRNNKTSGQSTPKSPSDTTVSNSVSSSSYNENSNAPNHNINDMNYKPYKCQYKNCTKSYKNPNGLAYHIAKVHQNNQSSITSNNNKEGTPLSDTSSNVDERYYTCNICQRNIKSLGDYNNHLREEHKNDYPASV